MNYNIFYFEVSGKQYNIVYVNRPFLRVKNNLKIKYEFVTLKIDELLFEVRKVAKRVKNKIFNMVKKVRKYIYYKYLTVIYRKDVDVNGLNIAGETNFSCETGEKAKAIIHQLGIDLKKLKVEAVV
jgi:hypothetical protein